MLAAQLPAQGGSGVVVVRGMKAGNGDNLVDDANDALQVNCVTGCGGSGGTSMTDEAAFTEGTTNITPVGGTYNATADQVTDGDGAAAQITQYRAWHV
ncbi:MAG: hypothetical protein GWO24_13790, partial [Akkermansiaceae bacterium]|nr:hypothetical protein [Akkermansiaceae bacterium]